MARLNRAEKNEQTKNMLIDAAEVLIAERGIENFSIDTLADTAGFSKGAFYVHFKTKDEILIQVMRRLWTAQAERLREVFVSRDQSAPELISRLVESSTIQHNTKNDRVLALSLLARGLYDKGLEQEIQNIYSQWHNSVKDLYEAIQTSDDGARVGDASDLAHIAMAFGHGYSLLSYAGVAMPSVERVLPILLNLLLQPERTSQCSRPENTC